MPPLTQESGLKPLTVVKESSTGETWTESAPKNAPQSLTLDQITKEFERKNGRNRQMSITLRNDTNAETLAQVYFPPEDSFAMSFACTTAHKKHKSMVQAQRKRISLKKQSDDSTLRVPAQSKPKGKLNSVVLPQAAV